MAAQDEVDDSRSASFVEFSKRSVTRWEALFASAPLLVLSVLPLVGAVEAVPTWLWVLATASTFTAACFFTFHDARVERDRSVFSSHQVLERRVVREGLATYMETAESVLTLIAIEPVIWAMGEAKKKEGTENEGFLATLIPKPPPEFQYKNHYDLWERGTAGYIEKNLGKDYVARFRHPVPGFQPELPPGIDEQQAMFMKFVHHRRARLEEFIKELRNL